MELYFCNWKTNSKILQNYYFSFQTNNKKILWTKIITDLQETRKKHKLEIRKFDNDVYNNDQCQELIKLIRYFIETLFQVKKEEMVYLMQTFPIPQQQEIASFMECDFEELINFADFSQFEFQVTNTIISLEDCLYSKENQLQQQIRKIESMKQEYQNQIQDLSAKILEISEQNEKQTDSETFFLQKLNCQNFEEAWSKFQSFIKELDQNRQQIEDLNYIVSTQQEEIQNMKSKYQQLKYQWQSNPPTARAVEIEQVFVKDQKEQKTIEMLKQQIQGIKEENQRVLQIKQTQYESELTKLKRKLYEAEQEVSSLKKKINKQKLELEELQSMKEPEKKNTQETLRHQGIYSQSNSFIIEVDQRFGTSPKSVCQDIFAQSNNKFDFDHVFNHAQSQKHEDNFGKLQVLLSEKTNKIIQLEKQLSQLQQLTTQCSHSRRNSMSKFNNIQQEKQYFDQASLLEVQIIVIQNLRFYVQYSQQKDQEIKDIREKQNLNFIKLSQQVIKQNEQISQLNLTLVSSVHQDSNSSLVEKHQEEIDGLNLYYRSALNEKDELLHLIISLFYDNVKN